MFIPLRLTAALLTACAGLALSPAALAQTSRTHAAAREADRAAKSDDLPIRRITLYRSGVGSFERRGMVEGNASVQLRFKTEQINDILKSMVVLDLSGKGSVDGISYGSKEPLSRRLGSFAVDISGNPTMGNLLAALRGSEVIVTMPDSKVEGVILGVETKMEPSGKDLPPVATEYLNLVTPVGIRSIKLSLATSVELKDKDLNAELGRALAAVSEYRADRSKTVDVNLLGEGARECVVAYVQESPVWKTSYRLVLPDAKKPGKNGEKQAEAVKNDDRFTMQAWAIVENTTDEDWKDVGLSLVAGRPVSFRMDLYEPLFVFRPELPVPTVPGVMPRTYAGGVDSFNADGAKDDRVAGRMEMAEKAAARRGTSSGRSQSPFREAAPSAPAADASNLAAALSSEELSGYAARAQGSATESGEVFMYNVDHPVTVERQRSAMIPLINAGIDGRRVSIFNPNDGGEHPMRGLEIKNSTNLQLMPGPISVFDSGAYAGDAQIGHIPAGDKRLLAYSVDLDVNVVRKNDSSERIRGVKISKGSFIITSLWQNSVTYTFANKDATRDRLVIVEQPRNGGNWELAAPKKAYETTDALYRFEVPVAAGKGGDITVTQESVQSRSAGVLSIDMPTLLSYSRQGKVSEAVMNAFREAQRLQANVAATQQRISDLEAQRSAIDTDQNRLRQNMQTIDRNTDLYKRYLNKLTEQETKVEQLADQLAKAQEAHRKAENDLDTFISTLDVE